jgi:hypothetical protein
MQFKPALSVVVGGNAGRGRQDLGISAKNRPQTGKVMPWRKNFGDDKAAGTSRRKRD